MPETFSRFDAAEHLTIEEDIEVFLEDAAQDGDPGAMVQALATVARARARGASHCVQDSQGG